MQTYLFVVLISLMSAQFSWAEEKKPQEGKTEQAQSEKGDKESLQDKSQDKLQDKLQDKSADESQKDSEKKMDSSSSSGEIFIIRSGPKTEVFLRNNNQSYFIPKDNKHNARLKDLQKRYKLNQPVTLQFNPKTREISDIQEFKAPAPPKAPTAPTGGADASAPSSTR